MRIDLGRSLLGRGYVERRRRRVAASRAAHVAAYTLFQEIHAVPWAQQARAALEPARDMAPEASADDATNREIAERLYLSVKTVEATLTRIYRKLEVRSRTQLARRMDPRG